MNEDMFAPHPSGGSPWDVAIIGSGPAALTAAIYTTRGAASTIILGGEVWGGQLMLTSMVDNYPGFPQGILGPELMENMKKQAERFGALFIPKNVERVNFAAAPFELTVGGGEVYKSKSVIVATGAETAWLGVPGESKLIGHGVSSCAPCDAPFFRNKKVAVIGGGDAAMEEASVLTKYASSVAIIHRRDEFKASAAMRSKVKENPAITLILDTVVKEMVGNDKLEKLLLENIKTGEKRELVVDGAFVAIGHTPMTNIFKDILTLDERGYLEIQNHTQTNVPGVFGAGDVHDHHYKQAITAAGFGCMAALDTLQYLDTLSK
jgi:thioredoxin reductase (NADPH)